MSGGRFNYNDSNLQYEMFDCYGEPDHSLPNPYEDREVSELMYDLLNLTHDLDWYLSGDTGRETYLKAKRAFKKKWLKADPKRRVQETIDKVLADAKTELYETYGIKEDTHNAT